MRCRSVLSVLATAPCVFFESGWCVCHDSWSRHRQIKCGRGGYVPKTLNWKAGAVCVFDCFDFHSPGLAGRQNDGQFTDSAPLSETVQHLRESRPLPRRPHSTGPVNIWCLLWMTWSEAFVVLNNLTISPKRKKKSQSYCFSNKRLSVRIILWTVVHIINNSKFNTDSAWGVKS